MLAEQIEEFIYHDCLMLGTMGLWIDERNAIFQVRIRLQLFTNPVILLIVAELMKS